MTVVHSHVQRHAHLVLGEIIVPLLGDVLHHVRCVPVDDVVQKFVPVFVPGFHRNSVTNLKSRNKELNSWAMVTSGNMFSRMKN